MMQRCQPESTLCRPTMSVILPLLHNLGRSKKIIFTLNDKNEVGAPHKFKSNVSDKIFGNLQSDKRRR